MSECPDTLCIWAVTKLGGMVRAVFERFISDADPNDLATNTIQCEDVCIENGGWGQITMKIRV